MILNVNATRMELTRLKKECKIAMNGHKLLKDKRDEMMRQFLIIAKKSRALRKEIEKELEKVSDEFSISSAIMGEKELKTALLMSGDEVEINVGEKNIMSVSVPVFLYENSYSAVSYSDNFATEELSDGINLLNKNKEKLLELAELEGAVVRLAGELEKTRRRVNALEYVMIPNYQDTISFIKMKIEENDRSNQTRLLKVKDMMIEQRISSKQKNY